MRGGATAAERGLAAEVREMHPKLEARSGDMRRVENQFNLLLNQVVHDKNTSPFSIPGAMDLIAKARDNRNWRLFLRNDTPTSIDMAQQETATERLIPMMQDIADVMDGRGAELQQPSLQPPAERINQLIANQRNPQTRDRNFNMANKHREVKQSLIDDAAGYRLEIPRTLLEAAPTPQANLDIYNWLENAKIRLRADNPT
jgi:hypothetical protein